MEERLQRCGCEPAALAEVRRLQCYTALRHCCHRRIRDLRRRTQEGSELNMGTLSSRSKLQKLSGELRAASSCVRVPVSDGLATDAKGVYNRALLATVHDACCVLHRVPAVGASDVRAEFPLGCIPPFRRAKRGG